MRTHTLTLVATALVLAVAPAVAQAAPTQLDMRIEGQGETFFEGPILTEGHDVASATGTKEDTEPHTCNGTNAKQHTTPGPTPTAAAADALGLIGETFSGKWYAGYDDYLVTRLGPEKEEAGAWHVVVNDVFTDVGGCQYELGADSELLWVYKESTPEPVLALLPTDDDYASGTRPLTATAALGKPFAVEVLEYADDEEDKPPATPERAGSSPLEGAEVAPVQTAANGFEKVEAASPETVSTNAEGRASIAFTKPGWHRIKAVALDSGGEEDAIRSNRLDVCVPAEGASGCGEPPAEDRVRIPHYVAEEIAHIEEEAKREEEAQREAEARRVGEAKREAEAERKHEEVEREEEAARKARSETLAFTATSTASESPLAPSVRVQTPALDGQGAARGLVGVSWRILEAGVGLRSWTIASKALDTQSAGWVTRATGTSATSALLALPPGAAYELQVTFTDVLGRSSSTTIHEVVVLDDDRWSGLHYAGRWRHMKQAGAWLETVSRGGAGAEVSVKLGAGQPVFLLRGTPSAAKVEVRAGSHREVLTVARGSNDAPRAVAAAKRSRPGTVRLRVLEGTVDLDGVAVEP
jgi:hypothetical protein